MMNTKSKVAIYCRLSEEDRNKQHETDDSNSIQNQKSMLIQYVLEQGWEVYNIYSDDDYTGSDRRRPEFNKLLNDAEHRKFDIILCKTQSRFTRELELVEKYIHGLFPIWGIRFISIVDNADTANKGNKKSRQINGLVNEWYLEDMSENIRSVLTDRRKNGFHIGAFALYGYKKDPEQKGHLIIDEEDSLSERFTHREKKGLLDIAVIRLPRISNFTDLMPLESMDEVGVRYVTSASQFGTPDAVILPGSKNTMEDLKWLRQRGLEGKILRHAASGKTVFGICGGYQMMGELLQDPKGVEAGGELKGMGLLPIQTVFAGEKMRTRVQGTFEGLSGSLSSLSQVPLEGYEIHMGVTTYTEEPCPLVQIQEETGERRIRYDGARKNNCYGCYVHGIFDQFFHRLFILPSRMLSI